jgi:hypothetical protein
MKEGPLSFVLVESPFTSVSTFSRASPLYSLVSLSLTSELEVWRSLFTFVLVRGRAINMNYTVHCILTTPTQNLKMGTNADIWTEY